MTVYKIAPTDLTFGYNECKRCFYNKVKGIWKKPYQPFPSVFSKIDACMRDCYHGVAFADIDRTLPPGVIDTTKQRLTSAPIPIAVDGVQHEIIFRGELDARVDMADQTTGITDFKTSEVKDQYVQLYARQLHACRDMLTYPSKGLPDVVSHLGLLCATPMQMTHTGEAATFNMKLTYVTIPIADDWWHAFLVEVIRLLEGPEPYSGDCHWCKVQRLETSIHQAVGRASR
jgi:hypothetical protein